MSGSTSSSLKVLYTPNEIIGLSFLVSMSFLSLIAVAGLLLILGISAYQLEPSKHAFIRTHVAAYLMCLLTCNLTMSMGSAITVTWIRQNGFSSGHLCTTQAVMKQFSNLGVAFWSLAIAVHTFVVLFFRKSILNWTCCTVVVLIWLLIVVMTVIGPTVLETTEKGPFYGETNVWCWITHDYLSEKYWLQYFPMTFALVLSLVLYIILFFRLRGNIAVDEWRISFKRRGTAEERFVEGSLSDDHSLQSRTEQVARQVLWHPLVYTVLYLPSLLGRVTGGAALISVAIITGTFLTLSGLATVILYAGTRNVLPTRLRFRYPVQLDDAGSSKAEWEP